MSYSCKIIADSINPFGDRVITFDLTYPRIVHADLMTHKIFSRNGASSRAIPFAKRVKEVSDNTFFPVVWQKAHNGMQGFEYFSKEEIDALRLETIWREGYNNAVRISSELDGAGVTKQICNRLLEPFMYMSLLVTTMIDEQFYKFLDLRCSSNRQDVIASGYDYLKESRADADIHFQAIADKMNAAIKLSEPNKLNYLEWHIPYGDKMSESDIASLVNIFKESEESIRIKIAAARCARRSYHVLGSLSKEPDLEGDVNRANDLIAKHHYSPFEHVLKTMGFDEYDKFKVITPDKTILGRCRNFTGYIPMRYYLD